MRVIAAVWRQPGKIRQRMVGQVGGELAEANEVSFVDVREVLERVVAHNVAPAVQGAAAIPALHVVFPGFAAEVEKAGKTWKDYVESWNGCGALNSGSYIVRHDPLQYFTNINKANLVCFSQFATDLANHALPNLSWLSPNGCDDAHDCGISTFDNWLQTEIGPLLASSYFQAGGDGLLIITFDEDGPNCTTTTVGLGCGGQVETVVISAVGKMAYKSTAGDPLNYNNGYDHASILRTLADALRVNSSGLGAAAPRVPMADFF